MGWHLLITADTLCLLNPALSWDGAWENFNPGEVPPPVVKLVSCPLAPSVLGLRPKPPPSRREVLRRAAAVNVCTVQLFSLPFPLGNDTEGKKAPLSKGAGKNL